ncbi:9196_t:CDS:1, partial [Paraglomus occultum]
VPLGFDDAQILQYVGKNYIFDYAHIGEAIRFFQDGRRPKTEVDELLLAKPEGYEETDDFSKFEKKFGFLPAILKDHFPY